MTAKHDSTYIVTHDGRELIVGSAEACRYFNDRRHKANLRRARKLRR